MIKEHLIEIIDEDNKGIVIGKDLIIGKEYPIYEDSYYPKEIVEHAELIEVLKKGKEFIIFMHERFITRDIYAVPYTCKVEITKGIRKGFLTKRTILKLKK